ncbi:MAG: MFS transporter [Promethearchaeota archaeon]
METKIKDLEIEVRSKVLLFVVLTANLTRYIGVSIIQIGLPQFVLDLSGTLISYGLVIGIFNITQSLFQFPFSSLSDKYGRRTMVLIGLLIYIAGTFLCYIANSILELLIYRAIQGAGAYSSILQAVVGDMYKRDEQGKGMALYSLTISLGYFAGTAIGGYVAFYLGFRSIFLITGLLAIITAILLVIFLKPMNTKEDQQEIQSLIKPKVNNRIQEIKFLLKNNQYQFAVLINCVRWLLFGAIVSYLIWVLQVEFKINSIDTSYILIINVLIYTIFLLIAGKFVDKHGAKKMLLISQIAIILFGFLFILVSLTQDLFIFMIASLLNALFFGIIQTASNTCVLQKISEENPDLKGAGLGFANAIGFLCSALGPIILSALGEIDIYLPYYFIMIMMIPAMIFTLKLKD